MSNVPELRFPEFRVISEVDQVKFVRAFRQLMRTLNVLKSFTEFTWYDLDLSEQEFEDYKSKYLDIYERSRIKEEGVSIVEEVDFELELIHLDEISVAYILKLLAELFQNKKDNVESDDFEKSKKSILDLLGKETQLRSKRELIEQFINDYMPRLEADTDIEEIFSDFWTVQKQAAISKLCEDENMEPKAVYAMIDDYHFSGKEPLSDTVFAALKTKPKLLERKKIFECFVAKLRDLISTFDDDIGNL